MYIIPGVSPYICKACSLPYSMIPLAEKELDRLVAEGTCILEPVQFAERAAPIVPVLKGDKVSIRMW